MGVMAGEAHPSHDRRMNVFALEHFLIMATVTEVRDLGGKTLRNRIRFLVGNISRIYGRMTGGTSPLYRRVDDLLFCELLVALQAIDFTVSGPARKT